jgi:hypothetical protein
MSQELDQDLELQERRLKNKLVSLWLHFWLKRIAKKYPDFFDKMLSDLLCRHEKKQL